MSRKKSDPAGWHCKLVNTKMRSLRSSQMFWHEECLFNFRQFLSRALNPQFCSASSGSINSFSVALLATKLFLYCRSDNDGQDEKQLMIYSAEQGQNSGPEVSLRG
jgi:hypothetical protein